MPLNELNQLELQFLLLNDFRLVIPVDELQRYADQLILFWIGRNGSTSSSSSNPPHPHPSTTTAHPQLSKPVGAPITSFPFPNANSATPTRGAAPNLTAIAVAESMKLASEARLRQAEEADHRHRLNSYSFEDPHSSLHSSTSSSSSASVDPYTAHRPHSIRSQPSSSGTSVTSTITPGSGTPTTPQGTISERDDIVDDHDEEGDDTDGEEGQLRDMRTQAGMRRDESWEESARGSAMDES